MRWGVVSTVSEPDPLVLAFVAACLARGAAGVELFLDRPQPSLEARLADEPLVVVTVCGPERWADVPGGRPWPQAARQRANLQRALDEARHPWLLHVDADEFLWGPDVGAALAALPDRVDHALVEAVERVHLADPDPDYILDGAFRRSCSEAQQAQVDALDGPAAPFLRRGLTAYVGGKSFVRTGRGLAAGVHVPEGADPARMARLRGHALLHFDGITPLGWVAKKRRTVAQQPEWRSFPDLHRHRVAQFAAVHAAGRDTGRLVDLYGMLKRIDPSRADGLGRMGLLLREGLDLRADVARRFPGTDLGVAAFDAQVIGWTPRRDRQWLIHNARAGLRELRRRVGLG